MEHSSKEQLLAIIEQQSVQIKSLEDLVKKQVQTIEHLTAENRLLRQKVDSLVRKVFGASSEKLDPNQLDFFLTQPEPTPGKPVASSEIDLEEANPHTPKKQTPRKDRLPEDLPVIEEVLDPEEVKEAPALWRCIGQEVSEQLDYTPAQFIRRRLVRRKYVARAGLDNVPIIAALPERLQERSLPAPGLLAHIIVSKFVDHLPLYRQEQIYWTRHQVWLPRQSQARWMELAADWLRPIYDAIRSEVLAGGYVQVDETPVRYLAPGHGQTKTGYFWTASRPGGDAVYQWHTSRAAECLKSILPTDFRGTVQCDGYAAYASFAKGQRGIELAGCWAHARRKFFEAREQDPQIMGWVLRQIGHLYRIEAALRKNRAGPRLRVAVRAHQSRPICQRIHRFLAQVKERHRYFPKSGPAQAINYLLNLWPQLCVYLDNGRIEIDQNRVENAIRPTALGKKNWLFIGEAEAGQRSAILYTLVESCRRRAIDPYAYLKDILTRLPHATNWQIKSLTPQAWVQAKQCAPRFAQAA